MHTTVVTYVEFASVSVNSLSNQLPLLFSHSLFFLSAMWISYHGTTQASSSLSLSLSFWIYLPLSLSLSRCSAVPPPLQHSSWRKPGSRIHTATEQESPVQSTTSGDSQGGLHDVILTHADTHTERSRTGTSISI